MKFASTLLRFFLQKTSLDFHDLLDFKNLALFFRISDVRVISLTVRSRNLKLTSFYHPWDGYVVTFCLCFCFERSSLSLERHYFDSQAWRSQNTSSQFRLSLKRGFGGCGHEFGRCDGLGGCGGFVF